MGLKIKPRFKLIFRRSSKDYSKLIPLIEDKYGSRFISIETAIYGYYSNAILREETRQKHANG